MACENCGGCKCMVELTDGALGGTYQVPAKEVANFKEAVARVHSAVTESASWHAAKIALDTQFGQYRLG